MELFFRITEYLQHEEDRDKLKLFVYQTKVTSTAKL